MTVKMESSPSRLMLLSRCELRRSDVVHDFEVSDFDFVLREREDWACFLIARDRDAEPLAVEVYGVPRVAQHLRRDGF